MLGVEPGASQQQVVSAYRALAKRWHPDRARGEHATQRMAEINVAYDLLRSQSAHERRGPPSHRHAGAPPRAHRSTRRPLGAWLSEPVRRALGAELLQSLIEGEAVRLVTPTTMSSSPRAFLALTDRRLLWLLDDAVGHRVRELKLLVVERVDVRFEWPLRRLARLRVSGGGGRRVAFGGLHPSTAALAAEAIEGAQGSVARSLVNR